MGVHQKWLVYSGKSYSGYPYFRKPPYVPSGNQKRQWKKMKETLFIDDFPSYKPPYIYDFPLPHLSTGGYHFSCMIFYLYHLISILKCSYLGEKDCSFAVAAGSVCL